MQKPDLDADKLRAEFDARWRAAIEQPETLEEVREYSPAADVTVEVVLSRLQELAKAFAAESLITPEEGERVAASADEIRRIMSGIDPEKLRSVARQLS